MEEEQNDFFEHIPSPYQWTDEARRKFAVSADKCPTCDYKFRYEEIQTMKAFLQNMPEDHPMFRPMAETLVNKQDELLDIGLMICGEMCLQNKYAFMALTN
jgi:hypothetical protein